MKVLLFLPVIVCLCLSPGIYAGSKHVGRPVNVTVQKESFKNNRQCDLSNDLRLSVQGHNVSITLYLHRTHHERVHIPVSVLRKTKHGKTESRFWKHVHSNDISYKDLHHRAIIDISCSHTRLRFPRYNARGFITINNQIYTLSPVATRRRKTMSERHDHEIEPISHEYSHDDILTFHQRHFRPRLKRQTVPEYKIDVQVLVDWKLYRHWVDISKGDTVAEKESNAKTNISRYIVLVFEGINLRYASIPNLKVTVNIMSITIFDDKTGEHVTPVESISGLVSANTTLWKLRNYVSDKGLTRADHVMLLTGHDVFSTDSGVLFKYTTGLAFVGTMCSKNGLSVSLVEDRGGFQSVLAASHELAHSLNATHDGMGNRCSSGDRYIMAGGPSPYTERNKANPWHFSNCSIQEIGDFFIEKMKSSLDEACLTQALTPDATVPRDIQERPGQLYGPDEQCRHIYGPTSYYCREDSKVSDICHSMFCNSETLLDSFACNEHHAADFTSCGDKKWCEGGLCVESQSAPSKNATCVHGDEPSRQINHKTCRQLVTGASYFCYDTRTRLHCCKTCAEQETGVQGCEYGDKQPGCDTSYCNSIYPNGTIPGSTCCGTCNYRPRDWTCEDSRTTPGLDCTLVKGPQCYNWTVAFHCCAACAAIRDSTNEGCEYGDKTDSCAVLTSNGRSCDSEIKPFCCKTCAPKDVNVAGHVTSSVVLLLVLSAASVVVKLPFREY